MDQAERLRRMAQGRAAPADSGAGPAVLVVTSGKGGVGKTTVAVNLSLAFASSGLRTVLVDADLGLSGVDVMMGLSPAYHLGHVLEGTKSLPEVALQGPQGLSVIPGGQGWRSLADASSADLLRIIGGLQGLPSRPQLLVIDTSPGISRNVCTFAALGHLVLVLTTPDPTAQGDAYASIKTLHQDRPGQPLRLLVNQASGRTECERVAKALGSVTRRFLGIEVPTAGFLPEDTTVDRALHLRKPLVTAFPRSPAALALTELAGRLACELQGPLARQRHGTGASGGSLSAGPAARVPGAS